MMRLAAVALAAALAAGPALAAQPWVIDKSHAQITFSADHLGFSVVTGIFREFDAEILFDPESIDATEISVTVDAASVDTFWEQRDRHLRSPDFLDVEAHPTITFVSTAVERTEDDAARITGDLTIRGETREIVLDARLNKIGPSPFNPDQTVAGFTLTGEVERARWGMTYGGTSFAEVVPIRIDVEMSPAE